MISFRTLGGDRTKRPWRRVFAFLPTPLDEEADGVRQWRWLGVIERRWVYGLTGYIAVYRDVGSAWDRPGLVIAPSAARHAPAPTKGANS